ncbi:MAG: MMPL family transporter, partial [Acidimicrobiia bacterium]
MKLNPESLARASSRHAWRTVIVWAVVFLAAGMASTSFLGDALTTDFDFTDQPESKRAATLLEDRLRGEEKITEFVIVVSESATAQDATFQAYVQQLQAEISALGASVVDSVGTYLTGEGPVSQNGRTTLLPVVLASTDFDVASDDAERIGEAVDGVETPDGFEVLIAGPGTVNNDFNELAEEGLRRGESIGAVIALIVLMAVFGAVVAAVLPIVLAVLAIAVAFGAAALVGLVFDLSFFITNMITMIGLAVGIDYSLFIVSRYREERARGRDKLDAIAKAG